MRYFELYEGRLKPLEFNKNLAKKIKKESSDAWKYYLQTNNGLYRGTPSMSTMIGYYHSALSSDRPSANTRNYYNLVFKNLPSWKGWPDRTKSIVGSTTSSVARAYRGAGDFYLILPINGAKIAVAPSSDFWDSFPFAEKYLDFNDLSGFNILLMQRAEGYGIKLSETDASKFYEQVKRMNEEMIENEDLSVFNLDRSENLWENFDYAFDPEKNHIKLITPSQYLMNESIFSEKEWWTEDPCYAIRVNDIHYLRD